MNETERLIFDSLAFFGPCNTPAIQTKLAMRGVALLWPEIDTIARGMIDRNLIQPATGFDLPAYKI